MKKAVITVMAVIMSLTAVCFAFGCTGTTQNNDNETLRAEIEDLKDRVEDLENKNNVFWTDKAEYSEHETMTVYFKDTAVFKIRLNFDTIHGFAIRMSSEYFNYFAYVTSLVSDINAVSVLGTSYITCEAASCLPNPNESVTICYKGKETSANGNFRIQEGMENATSYDFVICVPGTAFELARFVNLGIYKTS